MKPDNGDILYNGQSIINDIKFDQKLISICQQEDVIFEYLKVAEYIKYLYEIKNCSVMNDKIDKNKEDILNILKLKEKSNSLCKTLSEGEKRKLNLALSLIGEQEIILLDEPTRGLDEDTKKNIWEYLRTNKINKIIFIATYDIDEVINVADKIGIIDECNLIDYGTINSIKEKYSKNFYINCEETETPNDISFENIEQSDLKKEIKEKYKNNVLCKENKLKNSLELIIPKENENFLEILETIDYFGIEKYSIYLSLKDFFIEKYKNKILNNDILLKKKIEITSGFKQKLTLIKFLFSMNNNLIILIIYLIEFLFVIILCYIYIFYYSNFILNIETEDLNLLKLLETNPIYIHEYQKNYFKKSDVYSLSKSINFKNIKEEPYDIQHFINLVYEKSLANIAKGSISIKKGYNYTEAYNTYIFTNYNGYLYANTMLIVSSFLKNEYNIDASIFPEIKQKKLYKYKKIIDTPEKIAIGLSMFICVFNYLINLTGILYNKMNENNPDNNINCLFYYGINQIEYEIIFFIFYFLKLFFYNIIVILPILYLSDIAKYILLMFILINISSLIFIYLFSYLLPRENRGTKFIFIFILIIILFIVLLIFLHYDKIYIIFEKFNKYKKYNFTFLDITPISQMIQFLIRLFNSYLNNDKEKSLYIDIINQIINIFFYGGILFALKFGFFKKNIHYFKNILKKKENQNSNINHAILKSNEEIINTDIHETNSGEQVLKKKYNKDIISNNTISLDEDYKMKKLIYEILNDFQPKTNVIQDNNTYVLIHENGAGKTTLIKDIINEILCDKKSIYIYDKNDLKYCPQINIDFFNNLTIRDIFNFFNELNSTSIFFDNNFIKTFDLNNLDTKISDLSYSSKRKFMLAITIINNHKLLLLDNPLNGVDFISRYSIWKKINNLFRKRKNINEGSIILSTNLINEDGEISDKIKIYGKKEFKKQNDKKYNILYIKLDNSIIKNENIDLNEELHKIIQNINKLIKEGVDKNYDYFIKNPKIYYSLKEIYNFFSENRLYFSSIKLKDDINDILSFSFEIEIIYTYKKIFLINLIKMNKDNKFSIIEFK